MRVAIKAIITAAVFTLSGTSGAVGIELSSNDHPYTRATRVEDLAFIFVLTGDHDAAFDRIEQVLSSPAFFSVGLLALDPKWDPLRDHPRYAEIVEKYSRGRS